MTIDKYDWFNLLIFIVANNCIQFTERQNIIPLHNWPGESDLMDYLPSRSVLFIPGE